MFTPAREAGEGQAEGPMTPPRPPPSPLGPPHRRLHCSGSGQGWEEGTGLRSWFWEPMSWTQAEGQGQIGIEEVGWEICSLSCPSIHPSIHPSDTCLPKARQASGPVLGTGLNTKQDGQGPCRRPCQAPRDRPARVGGLVPPCPLTPAQTALCFGPVTFSPGCCGDPGSTYQGWGWGVGS